MVSAHKVLAVVFSLYLTIMLSFDITVMGNSDFLFQSNLFKQMYIGSVNTQSLEG